MQPNETLYPLQPSKELVKKAYTSPRLVNYGKVMTLTQGNHLWNVNTDSVLECEDEYGNTVSCFANGS